MKKYKSFLKLERRGDRYSFRESNNGANLGNLETFLSLEVISRAGAEEWKKSMAKGGCGSENITFSSIIGDEISINYQFDEVSIEKDHFTAKIKDLSKIIDEWFDLVEKQPAEIVIFEDENNKITMRGYDKPTPPWTDHDRVSLPRYFVIKIATIELPDKDWYEIEKFHTSLLKEKLDKKVGAVFFANFDTSDEEDTGPEEHYIFGIKYDKQKTVQDIANQFPELTWKKEHEKLVWEKEKAGQLFFDKRIKRVEIYTQV